MQRAAVDRGAADDFVARCEQRQQRSRRRRLAARQHERRLGAFERGDLLLDRRDRRIRVARIEELRRLPLVRARGPPRRCRTRTSSFRKSGVVSEATGAGPDSVLAVDHLGFVVSSDSGSLLVAVQGSPESWPLSQPCRVTDAAIVSWLDRSRFCSPLAPTTGSMNWR